MSQIKISEVTFQKLKNRDYEDVLPEYYASMMLANSLATR